MLSLEREESYFTRSGVLVPIQHSTAKQCYPAMYTISFISLVVVASVERRELRKKTQNNNKNKPEFRQAFYIKVRGVVVVVDGPKTDQLTNRRRFFQRKKKEGMNPIREPYNVCTAHLLRPQRYFLVNKFP